ncbi:MAG TPA: 8-oxo-dGTP diphosphatase MutT [Verrucomicrobiae bacterium]|nr:8-oxo-dGTP diphosphatase MutT [Verrucomicrobiae bacterium]
MGAEIIDVAAGLVFRRGQLLITQRPAQAHLGGLWEFPGGKREEGESFEQCLRRELVEELGIEVTAGELLEDLTYNYPQKTVRLKFFRCSLKQGEPRAVGCADLRWVTREQLNNYTFPPADARLLDRLSRDMQIWAAE